MSRKTLVVCDRSGREVGSKVTEGSDLVISAPWLQLEGVDQLLFEDLSTEDRRIVVGLIARLFKAKVLRADARDGSPLDGEAGGAGLGPVEPDGAEHGPDGEEDEKIPDDEPSAGPEIGGESGDDWTHATKALQRRDDYVSTRAAAEEGLPGSAANGAVAEGGSGGYFHRLNGRWWGPFPNANRAKRSHKAWAADLAAYKARKASADA